MKNKLRLKELKEKETLTDAEFREMITLSPKGSFKSLPNAHKIGIFNVTDFVENFKLSQVQARMAFEQGFFIETISLIIQRIEIYLRMFVVEEITDIIEISPDDKRTFGKFIEECKKKSAFDENLLIKISNFNHARIDAVHKYILGKTKYENLRNVCIEAKSLDSEVMKYVFLKISKEID